MISRRLSSNLLSSFAILRASSTTTTKLTPTSAASASVFFQCRREMQLAANKTLVNGQWISAVDQKQLAVLNPVNGQSVGCVPDMGATDAQGAIEAANKAFHSPAWNALTAKDRSTLLKVRKFIDFIFPVNIK